MRYNERVRVEGREASDEALVAAFERVEAARGETSLTYFEFGTLAAACIFADSELDAVIFEVGLGGRLDAVNVFDPDCAVVVSVDMDHMEYLGTTRESIGREKAGIFRAGRPAIYGEANPPATVTGHAQVTGARLLLQGVDFGFERTTQQWRYWGPRSVRGSLPHPALRGPHQIANAATAIAALDELKDRLPVHMQALRTGLVTASPIGRFQVLPGRPAIVLDVSHNPHAARALAQNLRAHVKFQRTVAVFAMLADKDVAGVVDAVHGQIDEWYVGALTGSRGSSAEALANEIRRVEPSKPVHLFDSVAAAYAAARRAAGDDDRIVVFGSFHTVADALQAREAAARST